MRRSLLSAPFSFSSLLLTTGFNGGNSNYEHQLHTPLLTNSEFSVRLYVEEMLFYGGLSVCLCFMFCVF